MFKVEQPNGANQRADQNLQPESFCVNAHDQNKKYNRTIKILNQIK